MRTFVARRLLAAVPTLLAVSVVVYYALPDAWLKVAWGVGAGAGVYLALTVAMRLAAPRAAKEVA